MLQREQKNFGLRSARKANTVSGLHTTVLVYRSAIGPVEYGFVQFDAPFIEAVGAQLPQGVSAFNPAFLQVHFDEGKKQWIISARYIFKGTRVVLWASLDFPIWLKELKKVGEPNAHRPQNAPRAASRACIIAS